MKHRKHVGNTREGQHLCTEMVFQSVNRAKVKVKMNILYVKLNIMYINGSFIYHRQTFPSYVFKYSIYHPQNINSYITDQIKSLNADIQPNNKQNVLRQNCTALLVQSHVHAHNVMTTLHLKLFTVSFQLILTTKLPHKRLH